MQVAASKIRAPTLRKMPVGTEYEEWSPSKKKKIKDNFLTFCDIVLAYTQYKSSTFKQEELRNKNNTSPLDSGVSTADSYTSDAALSSGYAFTDEESLPLTGGQNNAENRPPSAQDVPAEDDSYDAVTCFCGKPYSGRPMIECSLCLTWLHLTCAKVRRSNIPEVFVCETCRNSNNNKSTVRRKQRKSGGGVSTPRSKFKPGSSYTLVSPVSSESSQNSDPSELYSSTSPAQNNSPSS